jgi:hypothetical protein
MVQDILIPAFGWLVLVIIALTLVVWLWRTVWFMLDKNEPWATGETMGLPKGAVRTFIVISFTGIMFLIFFGDFPGIPAADRKWFLTAYSSVLSFYFGIKYFEARSETTAEKKGLAITRISPSLGQRPSNGTSHADIVIEGSGFQSPRAVTFTQGANTIPASRLTVDSEESVKVALDLAPTIPVGAYDVAVELANGSRVVLKSGFTLG